MPPDAQHPDPPARLRGRALAHWREIFGRIEHLAEALGGDPIQLELVAQLCETKAEHEKAAVELGKLKSPFVKVDGVQVPHPWHKARDAAASRMDELMRRLGLEAGDEQEAEFLTVEELLDRGV